jgi:hypothetical protein
MDEQTRYYDDAAAVLLSAGLRKTTHETPIASFNLNLLNTLSLSKVCDAVYGPPLRNLIANQFKPAGKPASMRAFFELESPQTECEVVLRYPQEHPVFHYCWICRTGLSQEVGKTECEHKLQILLSLVISGLYDKRLHTILIRSNRGDQYLDLLKYEYAYAHQRCNQIKSDTSLVTIQVDGRGVKRVQALPDPTKTRVMLSKILSETDSPTAYTPTPADLWTKIRTETPQWLGGVADETATVPNWSGTKPEWTAARTDEIGTIMADCVAKFNAANYTTEAVIAHFVNGLWKRACRLAPQAVREIAYTNLPPTYQKMVDETLDSLKKVSGGSNRKTRHRKSVHSTRRAIRGGGDEKWGEVWVYIAETTVKTICLDQLDAQMNEFPQGDITFEMLTEHVLGVLDGYVAWTEAMAKTALAQMTLEDSLPSSSEALVIDIRNAIITFVSPGWESKLEAVVNSYVLPKFTPVAVSPPALVAVAPQLVVDIARPAPMSEEDGAPSSTSGTASPISARAATGFTTPGSRVPSSSMASTAYGSEPRTSSQYSVGTLGSPLAFSLAPAPGSVPQSPSSSGESEGMPKPPIRKRVSERGAQDGDDMDVKGGGFTFTMGKRPDWL